MCQLHTSANAAKENKLLGRAKSEGGRRKGKSCAANGGSAALQGRKRPGHDSVLWRGRCTFRAFRETVTAFGLSAPVPSGRISRDPALSPFRCGSPSCGFRPLGGDGSGRAGRVDAIVVPRIAGERTTTDHRAGQASIRTSPLPSDCPCSRCRGSPPSWRVEGVRGMRTSGDLLCPPRSVRESMFPAPSSRLARKLPHSNRRVFTGTH
jgi:hypothetical protein